MDKQITVGVSGGVDSTVSLVLLREQGYSPRGVLLRMLTSFAGMSNAADAERARAMCEALGVAFEVVDGGKTFRQCVTDPFCAAYQQGRTPNPCVICNRTAKFPLLLAAADAHGGGKIATGHYARLSYDVGSGRYLLCRAADPAKDQTYMLCGLTQDILSRTVFPLGGLHKREVREIAAAHGLSVASQKDSQDICFVPDGDFVSFLISHYGITERPGDFLDADGKVIGYHNGALRYTLGQRRGFGVGFGRRIYVTDKDMQKNTVTLAGEDALFVTEARAEKMNWIACEPPTHDFRAMVKTRYSQKEMSARILPLSATEILAEFDEAVRAVTPGQAMVLYDGDTVIGGGEIVRKI